MRLLRLLALSALALSAATPTNASDSLWQRFQGSFKQQEQADPFFDPSLSAVEREERRIKNQKLSKDLGITVPNGFDPNLLSATATPKTFEELKMIRQIKNAKGNKQVEKRREELKAERIAEQHKQQQAKQQQLRRQQQGVRTYSFGNNRPIYRTQNVKPNRAVPVYRPGERQWSPR